MYRGNGMVGEPGAFFGAVRFLEVFEAGCLSGRVVAVFGGHPVRIFLLDDLAFDVVFRGELDWFRAGPGACADELREVPGG